MATLKQQIAAERRMRTLLEQNDLPQPDAVEYGYTCIRLFWHETKSVAVIDIDEPAESFGEANESPDYAQGERNANAAPPLTEGGL